MSRHRTCKFTLFNLLYNLIYALHKYNKWIKDFFSILNDISQLNCCTIYRTYNCLIDKAYTWKNIDIYLILYQLYWNIFTPCHTTWINKAGPYQPHPCSKVNELSISLKLRWQVEHFVDFTDGDILQSGYPPLSAVLCSLVLCIQICHRKDTLEKTSGWLHHTNCILAFGLFTTCQVQ